MASRMRPRYAHASADSTNVAQPVKAKVFTIHPFTGTTRSVSQAVGLSSGPNEIVPD